MCITPMRGQTLHIYSWTGWVSRNQKKRRLVGVKGAAFANWFRNPLVIVTFTNRICENICCIHRLSLYSLLYITIFKKTCNLGDKSRLSLFIFLQIVPLFHLYIYSVYLLSFSSFCRLVVSPFPGKERQRIRLGACTVNLCILNLTCWWFVDKSRFVI